MNKVLQNTIDATMAFAIAQKIGTCDFCVTLSRYATGSAEPWIITVGETSWRRHLVIMSITPNGPDAEFGILDERQSAYTAADFDTFDASTVVKTITLAKLIGSGDNKHVSVKNALKPKALVA